METILLKPDWDALSSAPTIDGSERSGHFVGRRLELDRLANEIVRSEQRAILFSGHRGVGKTSLVYESVREAQRLTREGGQAPTLIPVLLNANQLPTDPTQNREVLVALIRRLYRATRGSLPDIDDEIAKLYKRAVASKFTETQNQAIALARQAEERRERTITTRLPELDLRTLAPLAAGVASAFGIVLGNPLQHSSLDTIAAVLLAGPVPLLASATWRREQVSTSSRAIKDEAAELYEFDASPGNLEFDLEDIHRKLASAGKRVVYIVDEVDKLDPESAVALFAAFKTLFTLASAIFIFISDDKLYDHLLQEEQAEFRPQSYTFFQSRYFVGRPTADDLEEYFAAVTAETEAPLENAAFADTAAAIAFAAHGDFFDVAQRLRDRITGFDGIQPRIELRALTQNETIDAQLQDAISLVFERKYRSPVPSEWRVNERVLAALYSATTAWAHQPPGSEVADPSDAELTSSAVRDLYRLLERAGVLVAVSVLSQLQIADRSVDVKSYRIVGLAPGGIPDSLAFRTEPEEALVTAYDAFERLGTELWEMYRQLEGVDQPPAADLGFQRLSENLLKWGLDLASPRASVDDQVRALREEQPPPTYERSTLESWSSSLEVNLRSSQASSLPSVIANIIATVDPNVQVWRLTDEAHDQPFARIVRARVTYPEIHIASNPDGSRHLVILPLAALESTESALAEARNDPNDPAKLEVLPIATPSDDLTVAPRTTEQLVFGFPDTAARVASNTEILQKRLAWLLEKPADKQRPRPVTLRPKTNP